MQLNFVLRLYCYGVPYCEINTERTNSEAAQFTIQLI